MYEVKIEFKNGSRRTESGMTHAAAWGEYAGQVNGIEMATTGALRVSIMNQDTGRVLARYPMETAPPPKPKGELTNMEITNIQRMLVAVLSLLAWCRPGAVSTHRVIARVLDDAGATSERIHTLVNRLNDVAEGKQAPKVEPEPKAQAQVQAPGTEAQARVQAPTPDAPVWATVLFAEVSDHLLPYMDSELGYGTRSDAVIETGPDEKWRVVVWAAGNSYTIAGKGMEGVIRLRELLKSAVAYEWRAEEWLPCRFVGAVWHRPEGWKA